MFLPINRIQGFVIHSTSHAVGGDSTKVLKIITFCFYLNDNQQIEMKKIAAVFVLALLLTGCGSKISGTYSNSQMGVKSSYIFDSDGKVVFAVMGTKVEMKYELDGKDVKIILPGGAMIMTLVDENTIEGPMAIKYVKEK